ncbi:putative tRNA threonylcarbamoyladenosine biosynthesis protein Gcp [Desulfamplus magnetovallimortis]|uniref:tRNA N6-adenosine threonylcarbamoyltransferase n=1 Tax=Desulfamplus magnetovallimortis TaxID=1246637 RepID=A0A1W1HBS1_9BACT|nr:tRNA (adenosine(37)-N6)-threonylcarbamoyltransferase complex transferase subunit TsaD [Desulfamplus magnetovallimortis]SLM29828.1 putative tRNA threonylcarbamoyladenosine biosynthesis protein Gcp [Desulfamplus magnetovallimortis]
MIILGVESSCDETAAAVIENGTVIRSSVVSSQVATHHKYGGVVPELASRMHVESILPVVTEAISSAGVKMDDIEGVAVTRGPGLIGALLVGFSFAKAFAWARGIPWTGVNHLEGHIYSVLLSDDPPPFPFVVLLASGGHTNLYHVTSFNDFELMGQTRDDAAGEAFDKVAKMLGLGYPGGAVIEKLAQTGEPSAIAFPRSFLEKESFDFSFSGLKSAVLRYIHENNVDIDSPDDKEGIKADIAASFQDSVVDVLSHKLIHAAVSRGVAHIAVAGGVAANGVLRKRLDELISSQPSSDGNGNKSLWSNSPATPGHENKGIFRGNCSFKYESMKLHTPSIELCGDNAAMIAARGYRMILDGNLCNLDHDVFSRTRIK